MRAGFQTIALAGISGSGKTSLLRNVLRHFDFMHWTASDLIKEQIEREQSESKSSEELRASDIPDNQDLLVRSFQARSPSIESHIILDCHTIIDTPTGFQHISPSTFAKIGITDLIFLQIPPSDIYQRRINDPTRTRPMKTVFELAEEQDTALQAAYGIAETLEIKLMVLSEQPERELFDKLDSIQMAD